MHDPALYHRQGPVALFGYWSQNVFFAGGS